MRHFALKTSLMLCSLCIALTLSAPTLRAEDATPSPNAGASNSRAEKVDLEAVQKKYWAGEDNSQVEVVQKRFYPKAGKFSVNIFGGTMDTDPFLDVKLLGASVGYHLSEYFSINALYIKDYVTDSSAQTALQQYDGQTANTNAPLDYKAAELAFYPLYGKLSLMGKSIVYFDAFLLAGGGVTDTSHGTYDAFHFGLGGQMYLSKAFSLRLDYRLMNYTDHIYALTGSSVGTDLGPRNLWNGMVTFGFGVTFGIF